MEFNVKELHREIDKQKHERNKKNLLYSKLKVVSGGIDPVLRGLYHSPAKVSFFPEIIKYTELSLSIVQLIYIMLCIALISNCTMSESSQIYALNS